ncbi:MAG: M1 family peptidase [Sphingobacteriales bacterium]|nr:MAG: M1 family peptidase [Sphingobacteriales bacterium]
MNFKYFTAVLLALGSGKALAQIPYKPYFQQRVDHTIQVALDDKTHILSGTMKMHYTNNSPDTLEYIYMHLYPNAYSVDNSAFSKQAVENRSTAHYLSKKADWGYIDSLSFEQDGMSAKIVMTQDVDIIRVLLPQPILPGGSSELTTPFRVKIPRTFSRLGHEGNSYQVSQWFPKPAVYDKNGWHPMPYLDQGEFYSEYGSYDVSITLPENYVVMATGNLQTESEVNWLDEKVKQAIVDSFKSTVKGKIPSSEKKKTIRYTEDNIHDFAWFADKRWLVRKDTVAVPGSDLVSTVYVAYSPASHKSWGSSVQATKDAIKLYSEKVGPYPYRTVKVVEGALSAGGGMEYPTVTVISPGNGAMNDMVIIHEVGHNWFYGILGSNERMHPWMDEGINSFYEKVVVDTATNQKKNPLEDLQSRSYALTMATRQSMAIGLPSAEYTNPAYGIDVYGKAPAYLKWLQEYMGPDHFDTAMKAYFETWKFKHPQPEDFAAMFQKHSTKSLDWFFTTGLHSDKPVNYAIKGIRNTAAGKLVRIKNKTGFEAPVAIQVDSSAQLYWTEPFKGTTTLMVPGNFKEAHIASFIPDYYLPDNTNKRSFAVKAFGSLSQSVQNKLFIAPALGYNVYDRFMLGLSFHNVQLPERSFQYFLAPMYSFKANTVVGTGVISKAFYPNSELFREIDLNLEGKRFSYSRTFLEDYDNPRQQYLKIAPELRFVFKKPSPRSPLNQYLSLKGYYIQEGRFAYDQVDSNVYHPRKDGYNAALYGRIKYELEHNRTFNPYSFSAEVQAGETFAKVSATANLKIDYFYKKKAIYLRAFGGKMFHFNTDPIENSRYSFAATYSGWNDYLYDQTFAGRNMSNTLAAQQIYIKDGGMKVPTLMYANPIGISNDWMAAFNIKVDLPVGLPVQLFADFLTIADAKNVNPEGSKWLYDAGISFKVLNFADVYIPVLMSKEYQDYKTSVLGKNSFFKTIAFKFDLDKIYWPRMQREPLGM